MLKIVLFAAIPNASEITTTATNPGLFANPRVAIRTSANTVPNSAPAFILDLLYVTRIAPILSTDAPAAKWFLTLFPRFQIDPSLLPIDWRIRRLREQIAKRKVS